jgi:hypothetical protein
MRVRTVVNQRERFGGSGGALDQVGQLQGGFLGEDLGVGEAASSFAVLRESRGNEEGTKKEKEKRKARDLIDEFGGVDGVGFAFGSDVGEQRQGFFGGQQSGGLNFADDI